MKVVIVGGVAGGATAAARLRRLDEKAEILVVERSGFVSYANCGLPYYIGGVITKQTALTLQTPESFWNRFRVEVRTHQEVTRLNPKEKTVVIKRLKDGSVYEESYDKLILSPGAKPIVPDWPGVEDSRVFTLRTVEDTLRLHSFLEEAKPKRAVVVGGGFIGLEMAENLKHQGLEVELVERMNQVMPPLDFDMACELHAYLRSKGVSLRLGTSVEGLAPQEASVEVRLSGGESLQTDLVLLAIGVTPENTLAKEAGLDLGTKGSIAVNERMQTSQEDVYAVGDAVEVTNFVTGEKTRIPLAGPANKQGRIAADNICGRDSQYHGSQGSSILKLFDLTAAATGINETQAKRSGLSYETVVITAASHATYYPGAANTTVKALFDPETGKLLGAQIVGFAGVDKRIDVLAAALRGKLTAADLTELELAYAPPYSSAKDPVNMLGYVMENVRCGAVKQFHWHDVADLQKDGGVVFLDVRTAAEFARGHLTGAVNIPLDELRQRLDEIDPSKPLYVNCHSGLRSYIACRILSQNGFDCYNLSGGYRFYESVTQELEFDGSPRHPCGIKI